jgi:hypothetical protein
MSSTIAVAALLLLFASADVNAQPDVSAHASAALHPTPELPQAVLAHPAAETDSSLQAAPGWWSSSRSLAEWGGPWASRPGPYPPLYDHRYITW